jgi:GMP synthase-like glutamine amidotransferase
MSLKTMKKLRIHYFQHFSFEGLGCIEDWARLHGHHISVSRLYKNEVFPEMDSLDMLIIMGGPMGACDEDKFPWLKDEKTFIKNAIEAGKIVFGTCLGSQLMANALGANVYKNKENEIGWFELELSQEGERSKLFSGFEKQFPVFHWHGDTFDIPDGAVRLAGSKATKNQAFLYKEKALALQFHLEVTRELIADFVGFGKEELVHSSYVQTKEQILENNSGLNQGKLKLFQILDRLTDC